MPLRKSCDAANVPKNIRRLRREGIPQRQAVAIALATLKRGCGVPRATRGSPRAIVAKRRTR